MIQYYLSLGSNIEPDNYMPACIKLLQNRFRVLNTSSFYETDPVDPAGFHPFWNAVVEIETSLSKDELVEALREIETKLGRRRDPQNKFKPRSIDIDVLPQPDYEKLGFIIVPLAEIAPDVTAGGQRKTFAALAEEWLQEGKGIRKIIASSDKV